MPVPGLNNEIFIFLLILLKVNMKHFAIKVLLCLRDAVRGHYWQHRVRCYCCFCIINEEKETQAKCPLKLELKTISSFVFLILHSTLCLSVNCARPYCPRMSLFHKIRIETNVVHFLFLRIMMPVLATYFLFT